MSKMRMPMFECQYFKILGPHLTASRGYNTLISSVFHCKSVSEESFYCSGVVSQDLKAIKG
jgi:hypothetical protein